MIKRTRWFSKMNKNNTVLKKKKKKMKNQRKYAPLHLLHEIWL